MAAVHRTTRRGVCVALFAAAALSLTACGGSGVAAVPPGSTGTATTTGSSSTSETPSPTTAQFVGGDLSKIHDALLRLADAERKRGHSYTYYATSEHRASKIVTAAGKAIKGLLTSYPPGGMLHVSYVVGSYSNNGLLHCAPDDKTLDVIMVVDARGLSFTTITNLEKLTAYRVFDPARANKDGFDKDGFQLANGPCRTSGSFKPLIEEDRPIK